VCVHDETLLFEEVITRDDAVPFVVVVLSLQLFVAAYNELDETGINLSELDGTGLSVCFNVFSLCFYLVVYLNEATHYYCIHSDTNKNAEILWILCIRCVLTQS